MRLLTLLVACASLAAGQGATNERQKAADYPVSTTAGPVEIGAEYLIHAIPSQRGYYFAKHFLVVDVGVFPKTGAPLKVSANQFALRLNGAQLPLLAESPGAVAASLKYPDWGMPSGLSAAGGVGPVVISSDPSPVGRFPGDPNAPAPAENDENGPDYQLSLIALPDAVSERPVRGCVFFQADIKAKKIKSLLFEWTGPAGEHATLKLR
jgi:hypothetical protein